MFGNAYYHGAIRKATALVGTMFNDILVSRKSADGTEAQLISVPIVYGPREKYLARLERDPKLDQKTAINLPMISFEMTGMSYDGNRKLPTLNKIYTRTGAANGNSLVGTYNPVPYNIDYDVNVYANNVEDGARIIEQILPFFTPTWTATMKLLDEDMPNILTDVSVHLNGITPDDQYEGDFERRRAVMWRLQFTVKTYLYGPVSTSKIIKVAKTNLYSNTDISMSPDFTSIIKPGLTANGEPTSNSSLSIPYADINADDDWGFIITFEDNTGS